MSVPSFVGNDCEKVVHFERKLQTLICFWIPARCCNAFAVYDHAPLNADWSADKKSLRRRDFFNFQLNRKNRVAGFKKSLNRSVARSYAWAKKKIARSLRRFVAQSLDR